MKTCQHIQLILLLLGCSLASRAQSLLAQIETASDKIDSISVFVVGDSVLLRYKEMEKGRRIKRAAWVTPAGEAHTTFYLRELFSVVPNGDGVDYYYFDPWDETQLKAFNVTGNKFTFLEGSVQMPGEIVTSFVDSDLFLLSYNAPQHQLNLLRIKGLRLIDRKIFIMDKDYSNALDHYHNFTLFEEDSWLNTFRSGTRIYRKGDDLVFPLIVGKKGQYTMRLMKIGLHGNQMSTAEVPFTTGKKDGYSTFLSGDVMFVASPNKQGIRFQAIEISDGKPQSQWLIPPEQPLNCIVRTGRGNLIERKDSVIRAGSARAYLPHMSALPTSAGDQATIQFGLYQEPTQTGLLLVPGPFIAPLLSLATFVATTAIVQATSLQGVDRYFDIDYDGSQFTIDDHPSNPRARLDDWELQQAAEGKEFRIKLYLDYRDGLLGIYQYEKENRLVLMEFH